MTQRLHPSPTTGASTPAVLPLAIIATVGLLMFGCGGDDADAPGSIDEVTISPEAGYPGVDIEVALSINPDDGAEEDDYGWQVDFGDGNTRSGSGVDGTADHAYEQTGQYVISVEALHDGNVADRSTHDFMVHEPIDLSADSVSALPANVFSGADPDDVTVSFDIRNETASPVETPFSVHAYLAEDDDIEPEDVPDLAEIGSQQFDTDDGPALDSGQTRNVSITDAVPDIETGRYHAVVVIDPDHQLGVEDRGATIATSTGTIQVEQLDADLPNLSVQNLEALPERAHPELNSITRGFTLANVGGADIWDVVYKTYVHDDSELDDSAQLVDEGEVSLITAQTDQQIGPEQFTIPEPIIPAGGEDEEVYVIVEAFSEDGDVEESTTDNNVMVIDDPITVSDEPVDGPDIVVEEFGVSPNNTFLDGTLQLDTTISNAGTEDTGNFFCGIYMNEDPEIDTGGVSELTVLNFVNLAAGETDVIDDEFTIPAVHDPGTYYFFIVCDPVGAVDQPVRSNSEAMDYDPVEITDEADIDLYVADIVLPETADDGDQITVEASLCVQGSNPTGTTTGEIYTSPGTDVDFDADPVKTVELPNVDPGECTSYEFEVEARCYDFTDEMSVGLYADADETLPEDDTSGNRGTSTNPVALDGPYCECIEDDYGPNQSGFQAASIDPGAESEGALCAIGECDYFGVDLEENQSMVVTTEHDHERGPLETTLYGANAVQDLDHDDSEGVQQVVEFNSNDEEYVFSVCGQDFGTRNYYDFSVEVFDPPEGVDLRPHRIDIPSDDPFSIGQTIDVDLRVYNLGAEDTGEFDIELVLTEETEIGGPNDGTLATHTVDPIDASSHRNLSLGAPLPTGIVDGDYHIAILLDPDDDLDDVNPDENIAFTPQFSVETGCYDVFSPNQSFADAASIDSGTYNNLAACAGQSDYYEICAPDASTVDASIEFDPDQGDIDLYLHDDNYETIDSSAQTGVGLEEVGVDYVDGQQCYYLRAGLISLDDEQENAYDLTVDIEDIDDPDLICDSTFEPNDAFATATNLWTAINHEEKLDRCPEDDVDYYKVNLSTDVTVDFSASLDPEDQSGTLRLQLYDTDQVPVETVETGPGQPTVTIDEFEPDESGIHYLRVSVTGNEHSVTYVLDADGLPGIDLAAEDLSIGSGDYEPGDKIRYDYQLVNYGADAVSPVEYHAYLLDDDIADPENLSDDDIIGGPFTIDDLDANSSKEIEGQVHVPPSATAGAKYFAVYVEAPDEEDLDAGNNIDSVPIDIVESEDDDNGDDNGDDDNGDDDNGDGDNGDA